MSNIFIGHFGIVLEELLKHIPIDLVIVEDKPANKDVKKICDKNNINCITVSNYNDIVEGVKDTKNIGLCVVASFGIVFKDQFIKKCKYIVNFHPGDIDICRGRHPLPVAILNKHKTMGITAHLINSEKIDAGPVLAKVLLPIDYGKSYRYNESILFEMLKLLTKFLMGTYSKTGRFIAYEWDYKNSTYFKPLKKEILDRIINSNNLEE